ncbi:TPA: LysR family transcriptional regulator [Photobacterium damselae]|uniref:LysR family transcriptional regulator n=1 Tax=Photobacterium damselae TaxID=38293 RepID=UPI00083A894F|nr:LysR family transcriptional regulator [Photobacterium damselae]ARR50482.1 LysR family transcriptional regulator [Photobacterium damselae subsp. damselae]EJN6959637.1 LysR family transcriptional regulator [Photobacterium damselae]KAB1518985.1 LysR family transcriptional regulator [Photobacterium damselae subsp. damselae]MCG3845984.1 LysR family transcriptional regulator [Photobacterium damselae]MCG9779097.1 LysR family transcriptional regulator [Photobacterium damselae]
MDLRLLRFFTAVYEEKNITLAAERCFVSQPSISSAIKQLEQELDTTLFIRHKKGVNLTDEAHYLYPLAIRLLNDVNRLPQLFQQRTECLPLTLANFPDLSQTELANCFALLNQQIPNLLLELVDHNAPADARLTLDMFKAEDEIFLPLWDEDYVLCMLPDHPLAQLEKVTPAELHLHDFIECPPCEAHQQTIGLLACDGLAVNLVAKAEHKTQVMHLVQAGLGISFLPTGVLETAQQLVTVPLDGPRMFRRLGLCYPANKTLNPALSAAVKVLSQYNQHKVK